MIHALSAATMEAAPAVRRVGAALADVALAFLVLAAFHGVDGSGRGFAWGVLVGSVFLLARDAAFHGRGSPGKLLFGLRVSAAGGRRCPLAASAFRNLLLAAAFVSVVFSAVLGVSGVTAFVALLLLADLSGLTWPGVGRLSDRIAGTQVTATLPFSTVWTRLGRTPCERAAGVLRLLLLPPARLLDGEDDRGAAGAPPGGTCLLCGEAIRAGRWVRCARCGAGHHEDCWALPRSCFACRATTIVLACADPGRADPAPSRVPFPWGRAGPS